MKSFYNWSSHRCHLLFMPQSQSSAFWFTRSYSSISKALYLQQTHTHNLSRSLFIAVPFIKLRSLIFSIEGAEYTYCTTYDTNDSAMLCIVRKRNEHIWVCEVERMKRAWTAWIAFFSIIQWTWVELDYTFNLSVSVSLMFLVEWVCLYSTQ